MYIEIDTRALIIRAMKNANVDLAFARQERKYFNPNLSEDGFINQIIKLNESNKNLVYIDRINQGFSIDLSVKLCLKYDVPFRIGFGPNDDKRLVEFIEVVHPEYLNWKQQE